MIATCKKHGLVALLLLSLFGLTELGKYFDVWFYEKN